MSTTEPMVPRGPLDWSPWTEPGSAPRPKRRRHWVRGTVLAVLVLLTVAVIASNFITLPYYAIAPGSARRVDDLVQVSDQSKVYHHQGEVLFTTVSLYKAKTYDAIQSWFNHNIDLVPQKAILGTTKPNQLNQQNLQEMTESKDTAVDVAFRRIGAREEGKGTLIAGVESNAPATGRLNAGDVVLAIDGKPTLLSEDAIALIHQHKPGDTSQFLVQGANGQQRTVAITYAKNPTDETRAYVGVGLTTKDQKFDVPYTVKIDSGQVGGPSAGLAFTLEVIDTLTPGDLTGGKKVAVTGTIAEDGTVGEVGGVPQKTAAVKAAGAHYFLVPASEYDQAKEHAGKNLTVIPVHTLEDALTALHTLGGDTAPLGPPPASLQR